MKYERIDGIEVFIKANDESKEEEEYVGHMGFCDEIDGCAWSRFNWFLIPPKCKHTHIHSYILTYLDAI